VVLGWGTEPNSHLGHSIFLLTFEFSPALRHALHAQVERRREIQTQELREYQAADAVRLFSRCATTEKSTIMMMSAPASIHPRCCLRLTYVAIMS
jgi:hypothetical protein